MKSLKSTWLGAEAERDGTPLIVRARDISVDESINRALPILFSIELSYEMSTPDGLPTPAQYQQIEKFESEIIDEIERQNNLILVFVETGGGLIRYFTYVADVDLVSRLIDEICDPDIPLEFSAKLDPDWGEYRNRRSRVK